MPDNKFSRHTSGLRRLVANNLVIYTTEPEVRLRPQENLPTGDELVQNLWLGTLRFLGHSADVIEIGTWLKSVFDDEPAAPAPVSPTTPVTMNCVNSNCAITINYYPAPPPASPGSPAAPDAGSPSPAPAAPPQDAPDAGSPSPAPAAPPQDAPKVSPSMEEAEAEAKINERLKELLNEMIDSKRIDPVDPSVPTLSNAGDTFDKIMNDYLSMEFDDAEAAAAYLQQRVSDAGIEVRITSNGYEVESAEPDPGNVAALLRGRGVTDRVLIQQAVREANVAISAVETFVQDAQATIPVGGQAGGVAPSVPQQGDPWAVLVPEWIPLVPDGFDLHLPTEATGVPTEITPRVLMSMERKTASGVIIGAQIATAVINVVDSGLGSGYHVAPFVSVFEKWTLRA